LRGHQPNSARRHRPCAGRLTVMDAAPSSQPGQPSPLLSIALRDGGTLDLWPDRLTGGDQVYPLADLRRVRLDGDVAAPFVSLGMPGRTLAVTPADPPD